MFAHQDTGMENVPFGALKRGREDDGSEIGHGGSRSFAEHRNKRLQTLPLRSAPASNRWSQLPNSSPESLPLHLPNSLTPSDSDPDEAATTHFGHYAGPPPQQQHRPGFGQDPRSNFSAWSSPAGAVMQEPLAKDETLDCDTEMTMDSTEDTSPEQTATDGLHNGSLQPGPFHPDSVGTSITGRVPTPILPNFAAQVRGNNWGGAAGSVMQNPPQQALHQAEVDAPDFGAAQLAGLSMMATNPIHVPDRTVPRSLEHPAAISEWSLVQNRPLPSPISESGGEELGSPGMVLDSSAMMSSLPPRASSAMELPMYLRGSSPVSSCCGEPINPGSMDMKCDPEVLQQQAQELEKLRQQQPSPATPSPKKGHTRSRHTVNNWTHQPGMKKSFSIGYRADCEKCRLKVPGHFNHIIIS